MLSSVPLSVLEVSGRFLGMSVSVALSQVRVSVLTPTISMPWALQEKMHQSPLQCPRDTKQQKVS